MIHTLKPDEMDTCATNPVVICQSDFSVLKRLATAQTDNVLTGQSLKSEIERAIVVQDAAFPPNTVRINSTVEILNLTTGKQNRYKIVLPGGANIRQNKISVLTPMGTALLGFREGDTVQWQMPGSMVRLKITNVINQ